MLTAIKRFIFLVSTINKQTVRQIFQIPEKIVYQKAINVLFSARLVFQFILEKTK